MSLINCPECNKEISDRAKICPNCGYPINIHINENTTIDENNDNTAQTKNCPFCKSENHIDATVCKSCGKKISKSALTTEALRATGQGLEGCGCLLMLIFVIAIGAYILFSH